MIPAAFWESLHLITDSKNCTFDVFCASGEEMRQTLQDFAETDLPDDPRQMVEESDKAQGWLGYANNRAARAASYKLKAMGMVQEKLAFDEDHKRLGSNQLRDIAKGKCWRFIEEDALWTRISTSLQDRVWSSRAKIKAFGLEYGSQE